jgi:hypothetical protein
LVERIAKSQCRTAQEVYYPKDDGDIVGH